MTACSSPKLQCKYMTLSAYSKHIIYIYYVKQFCFYTTYVEMRMKQT